MNDILPPVRPPQRPTVTQPAPRPVSSGSVQPSVRPNSGPQTILEPEPTPTLSLSSPAIHPRRRRWPIVLGLIIFLVSILIAGAIAAYLWYADALKPKSTDTTDHKFVVAQGASADAVAANLQTAGLIKSSLALSIHIKLEGKNNIQAGSYVLRANQAPSEIWSVLQGGKTDMLKVTILPGKILADLKKGLVEAGFGNEEVEKAFAAQYQHAILEGRPTGASLEGYLYPETYFLSPTASVEDVINAALDEFQKQVVAKNLKSQLAARGLTLFQGITLASIVEAEVPGYQDQRQASQVFQKRLQEGIVLGSDVTYHYAAKILGVAPSTQLESPYNTRLHPGLPPGPIGNFRLTALQAIADPAPGDYLFFVAGDDGTTHFTRTVAEHEAAVAKYCTTLCSQP